MSAPAMIVVVVVCRLGIHADRNEGVDREPALGGGNHLDDLGDLLARVECAHVAGHGERSGPGRGRAIAEIAAGAG
jgi:hypothetical protein